MSLLFAPTEDIVVIERTRLSADASAGSNVTLTVKNNSPAAIDTYVCIGMPGSEEAEMCQVNAAPSGAADMRVATLVRAHKDGEMVVFFRYNQRKFYGSTAIDGTYVELSGSPVDIAVDDPQGAYLEYAGTSYTYFKATYFNGSTSAETDIDDSDAMTADARQHYCWISEIRDQAGLNDNPYFGDGKIERKRLEAENLVKSMIAGVYVLPLPEIPPLLRTVTILLAAGYLDFGQYGRDGEGVKWLGEAKGILKNIQEGRQLLLGADDTELPRLETGGGLVMDGEPNGTDDNAEAMFEAGQTF